MSPLQTSAFAIILTAAGALGAVAQTQGGGMMTPPAQQPRGMQPGRMMGGDGPMADHPAMGGGDGSMMMGGMMGNGRGPRGGRMGPPPMMMRMMFAIADADGNGSISLEEMQEIHARMFRAVAADHDGGVTPMRAFMHPGGPTAGAEAKPAE
ncbi:MAG: hypothetical protein CML46_21990 [Rhodobacteraceae bacterium]|nr:hypothetical protein [Paracoccaceae bacterium]MBR29579.1 hypothetical protein [Paracoccaceae bacterium]